MQKTGQGYEIILFIFSVVFLLSAIIWEIKNDKKSMSFLFLLYFFFFFLTFKAGFVLHFIHGYIAGSALIISAITLPFVFYSRFITLAVCFSVFCGFYVKENYDPVVINGVTRDHQKILESIQRPQYIYASAWSGFVSRLQDHNWLRRDFNRQVESLKTRFPFPRLGGTTDIYSWNQAALIASGNKWNPRPIFQSHCAYTEVLALKNREHLLGSKAPDNIIFKVEPVLDNLPSLEDGASWPILLSHYKPTQMENGYLFLRKRENLTAIEGVRYETMVASLGENITVPYSNQLLFAALEIRPTLLGKIANFVFKSTTLDLSLTLKNGEVKTYRMVSGMAKAGFLISPLVEDTQDFSELYEKTNIHKERVQYFSIEGNDLFWHSKYTITFSENDI